MPCACLWLAFGVPLGGPLLCLCAFGLAFERAFGRAFGVSWGLLFVGLWFGFGQTFDVPLICL